MATLAPAMGPGATVKAMRAFLTARGVDHTHCLERAELSELVRESQHLAPLNVVREGSGGGVGGERAEEGHRRGGRFDRRRCSQLRQMMLKSFLVKRRRRRATMTEVGFPVYFVAVLWLIAPSRDSFVTYPAVPSLPAITNLSKPGPLVCLFQRGGAEAAELGGGPRYGGAVASPPAAAQCFTSWRGISERCVDSARHAAVHGPQRFQRLGPSVGGGRVCHTHARIRQHERGHRHGRRASGGASAGGAGARLQLTRAYAVACPVRGGQRQRARLLRGGDGAEGAIDRCDCLLGWLVHSTLATPASAAALELLMCAAGVASSSMRVRVEIMGSQKCGIVGKSRSVPFMINPIIFTRTRMFAFGAGGARGAGLHCAASRRPRTGGRRSRRGGAADRRRNGRRATLPPVPSPAGRCHLDAARPPALHAGAGIDVSGLEVPWLRLIQTGTAGTGNISP
jgi:hypothetical protein